MKLRWHSLLVALLALFVSSLFLRGPGFGDDLTYWTQAFDTHERGLKSIERFSFHDLRWPVWGVSWVIQGIVGFGMGSFYGVPLFYLTLGALVAFTLGRMLLRSTAAGWAAAIGFIFHPLLDPVCFRPMPDLSEGILGATAMLTWWATMNSERKGLTVLWAVVTGLLVFITEANRVTGAFFVPLLIVCTLAFFPRRFGWLLLSGVVAAACYAGEMVIYHGLFGDWFHHIHANMNNAENKGTEPMPLWKLPIRFLDSMFWNRLARPYGVLALIGIPLAWKRWGALGRVVVIWFVLLFLEYSCMPQPVWPIRPMVRDADRFLAALAIPYSLLSIVGLFWLIEKVKARWNVRFPAPAFGALAVLLLWMLTNRERFDRGFVPEFHDYLATLKPGTKVFTHDGMRALAYLCNEDAAKQLTFNVPSSKILFRRNGPERRAAESDEFWYARKLVWLSERKQLESGNLPQLPELGSYFDSPERDWTLAMLLAKGDSPDLVFFKRRRPQTPAPTILLSTAPEFAEVMPALPRDWAKEKNKRKIEAKWKVPQSLRGKPVWLELVAGSDQVEAFTLRLEFKQGGKDVAEFLLKPYLHPGGGKDFFAIPFPADADNCELTMKVIDKAKKIHVESFRAVVY
jgi:hypothetical protein